MSRRRGLTPEDRSLWARVAESVVPLEPGLRNQAPAPAQERPETLPPRRTDPDTAPVASSWSAPGPAPRIANGRTFSSFDPAPTPVERLAGQPLRMHHKTHRQMTQGKLRPEARIDLHGMTLAVAQPALARFILDAHIRGHRLVLVITGKGRTGDADAPLLERRPGALRHNVPHWLQMTPLSSVVLQVAPAHRRHGGEGAYYVYLRRSGIGN